MTERGKKEIEIKYKEEFSEVREMTEGDGRRKTLWSCTGCEFGLESLRRPCPEIGKCTK